MVAMRSVIQSLAFAVSVGANILPSPQSIFSNLVEAPYDIPTVHESAIQARRILRLENIATLSTVFPGSSSDTNDTLTSSENRPSGLEGSPIGLMDYYADCELSGNPSILAISIATSFKNVDAGSKITLSLRWHPTDGIWHSAASLPRFSLIGHLQNISPYDAVRSGLAACFVQSHPDAVAWLPGNRIHESHFVRLVVDEIYWIGGFGDRAYIGWIPVDEWKSVTSKEIEDCKLPGEKKASMGWKTLRQWL